MIPRESLQNFRVEVVSTKAHIPDNPDKPLCFSDDVVIHPITAEKDGSGRV